MASTRRRFSIGLCKSRTEDVIAVLADVLGKHPKKRRGYIEGYILKGIIYHHESPIKPDLVFGGDDLVKSLDWTYKKDGVINSLLTKMEIASAEELSGLMTYYFIHGVREVLKMNLENEMQLFQVFGVNRANALSLAITKESLVGNNDSVSIEPMVNAVRNVDMINSEFLSATQIDEDHFSEYGEEEEDEIEGVSFGTTFDEEWSTEDDLVTKESVDKMNEALSMFD